MKVVVLRETTRKAIIGDLRRQPKKVPLFQLQTLFKGLSNSLSLYKDTYLDRVWFLKATHRLSQIDQREMVFQKECLKKTF